MYVCMYVCMYVFWSPTFFFQGQLVKCQQSSQSTKKKHQPCCLWQEATAVIWPLGQRPNKKQNQLGPWGSQGYHSTKKPLKLIVGPDLPVRFHGFGGVDKCLPRISQVNYKVRLTDPKKESLGHWTGLFIHSVGKWSQLSCFGSDHIGWKLTWNFMF